MAIVIRIVPNWLRNPNWSYYSSYDLAAVRPTRVYLLDFFCSSIHFYALLSPYLCFISFLYLEIYVLEDDAWIS